MMPIKTSLMPQLSIKVMLVEFRSPEKALKTFYGFVENKDLNVSMEIL